MHKGLEHSNRTHNQIYFYTCFSALVVFLYSFLLPYNYAEGTYMLWKANLKGFFTDHQVECIVSIVSTVSLEIFTYVFLQNYLTVC